MSVKNIDKTRITYKSNSGKITIELNESDMDIAFFIKKMVKPMLLSIGYSSSDIENVLRG